MREIEDLTGQVFGNWTVLEFSHKDKYNHAKWVCKCGCGIIKTLFAGDLKRGSTLSCGCLKNQLLSKQNIVDIVGQRFNFLTVESFSHVGEGGAFWNCKCDCGEYKVLRGSDIKSGETKSCGCYRREVAHNKATHGRSKDPVYIVWRNMCSRCYDPKSPGYKNYGGRGIAVCDEWRGEGGFIVFLRDMGEIPEGYTLDRINVNGNYERENCRWATTGEQGRNKRNNRSITFNGEDRLMVEWSEFLGISYKTLKTRLNKLGWSVEKAFTTPVEGKPKNGRRHHKKK